MATKYFSFQGKVYLAEKNADGTPKAFRFVGNAPAVTLAFETTTIEHKESTSCSRLTDFQLETEKKATLSVTLEEIQDINMRAALRADVVATEGDTVTDELIGPDDADDAADEDLYTTKFQDISAITLTDNAGAAMAEDTDWELVSAKYGMIRLLVKGANVFPLKIAYTHADNTSYPFFNAAQKSYYFRGELCNTAEANAKYLVELYKVQLKPTAEFAIINDEIGQFVLEGAALLDEDFAADPVLGQYGRLIPIAE